MSNRVKPVKAKKLSRKELTGYSKNFLKFTITMSPPVFCFLRAVDSSPRFEHPPPQVIIKVGIGLKVSA